MGYYLFHVNEWKYFEFTDGSIIGRTNGDLTYEDDNMMSGTHAKIHIRGTENIAHVFVEDLKSKNGTFINKNQVGKGEMAPFTLNSVLEVGSQKFILTDRTDLKIESVNRIVDRKFDKSLISLEAKEAVDKIRQENIDKLKKVEADEKKLRSDVVTLKSEIESINQRLVLIKAIPKEELQKAEQEKARIDQELDKKRQEAHTRIEEAKQKAIAQAQGEIEPLSLKVKEIEAKINEVNSKADELKLEAEHKRKKLEKYIKIPD